MRDMKGDFKPWCSLTANINTSSESLDSSSALCFGVCEQLQHQEPLCDGERKVKFAMSLYGQSKGG